MGLVLYKVPLTEVLYGILGLVFLRHKKDGFMKVHRNEVYRVSRILAGRYPKYFLGVYFSESGTFPYSQQIEDALSRLLGGVLGVRNPRGQYLCFEEEELLHVTEKLEKWLDALDRIAIGRMAEEFYEEVRV